MLNVNATGQLVTVGAWEPCDGPEYCTRLSMDQSVTFSTVDNSQPMQLPPKVPTASASQDRLWDASWFQEMVAVLFALLLFALIVSHRILWLNRAKAERRKKFREKCERRRCNGDFVPLIYELDEDTEFKLEESEREADRHEWGALSKLTRDIALSKLTRDIGKVQDVLVRVREERIQGWQDEEHGKDKCHKVIKEFGGMSDVYDAVFQITIEGKEHAEMTEYETAADALRDKLLDDKIAQRDGNGDLEWPQCKQSTIDLAELYMEAVSVKERARMVMTGLTSKEGLEMSPLKKMRCVCVLQASPHQVATSHQCLLCA